MANSYQATSNIDRLKSGLKYLGYDYELLTAKQQKYLKSIDDVIEGIFRREKEALDMMSGNSINIKRIAFDIGVTRDTIYNNQVLRDYIDYWAGEFKKIDVSVLKDSILEENTLLRTEVASLHLRDVEYEETKIQLADAMAEIERLKQQLTLVQSGNGFNFTKKAKTEARHIIQLYPPNKVIRIVTWNVNGLSSCVDKGFFDAVQVINPDIICLQETRINAQKAETFLFQGFDLYWNHAKKKGYSGTAVFSKVRPVRVFRKTGIDSFDREGRILTVEFDRFCLVNCYVPASQEEFSRLNYRMEFDDNLHDYIQSLEVAKPVILCGDFNVVHKEIDTETPFSGLITNVSNEERERFNKLLNYGYDDAFRFLNPSMVHVYSWWPYTDLKRSGNTGLRLDYFLTSKRLRKNIVNVSYRKDILGSDHCPVVLDVKLPGQLIN